MVCFYNRYWQAIPLYNNCFKTDQFVFKPNIIFLGILKTTRGTATVFFVYSSFSSYIGCFVSQTVQEIFIIRQCCKVWKYSKLLFFKGLLVWTALYEMNFYLWMWVEQRNSGFQFCAGNNEHPSTKTAH